jgi:hypothetical protein
MSKMANRSQRRNAYNKSLRDRRDNTALSVGAFKKSILRDGPGSVQRAYIASNPAMYSSPGTEQEPSYL